MLKREEEIRSKHFYTWREVGTWNLRDSYLTLSLRPAFLVLSSTGGRFAQLLYSNL